MNDLSEGRYKKETSSELINELKEKDNENKIPLYEFSNTFSINKRYSNDQETKDIENFLEKLSLTPKKLNNNPSINYIKKHKQIQNPMTDNKNSKLSKVKFRIEHLKLKNQYKNDKKDYTRNVNNFKLKKKLFKEGTDNNAIETPIKNTISSSIFNFKDSSLKLKKRNLNNKNIINSPSFNNISSSIVNETNYMNQNLSSPFKIHKKNYNSILFLKKNKSFIINQQLNKLNNYIGNNYNKFKKNNKVNTVNLFKDTEGFIKDSLSIKNKSTLKRNIILKNFSTFFDKNNPNNNSISSDLRFSPLKRDFSSSPNNSLKKMRGLYKKTDFEKLVFKMNKRLIINKKKESKSYTFEQILKNCEIYISKFN